MRFQATTERGSTRRRSHGRRAILRGARLAGMALLAAVLMSPAFLEAQPSRNQGSSGSKGSSSGSSASSGSRSSGSVSRSTPSSPRSSARTPTRSGTRNRTSATPRTGSDSRNVKPPVRTVNPPPAAGGSDRRASSGGSSDRHYHGYPYYPYGHRRHHYSPFYYSYHYYPYHYYGPYGYFYYPYPRIHLGWGARGYRGELGGLDLDVRPEDAQVFIDGNPVGVADQYDGFPSYLWLEPGTYHLTFYMEGRRTISREYTIYPGVVIDVKDRMQPGEAVKPKPPSEPPRRSDARIRSDRATPPARPDAEGRSDSQVGRIQLSVLPGDTAVYLDGHFLGTGAELSQLSAGLIVEPGDHVLELVRPGYLTEEMPISVSRGEKLDVDVELEPR